MVYSEELGYDPDEWEECPPPDHFLVFSPFTRLLLSVCAIGSAAAFFWLVENHKSRGKKEEEEVAETVPLRTVREVNAAPEEKTAVAQVFEVVKSIFGGGADFVQQSFATVQEVAAPLVEKAEEQAKKLHYERVDPLTQPNAVSLELEKAEYDLRDLLPSDAPPVPPHRSFDESSSKEEEAKQKANAFVENLKQEFVEARDEGHEMVEGARRADEYQRVQRQLDDIVGEGEKRVSAIDLNLERLSIRTADQPSAELSLHEVYEQQQRQMSPPLSPMKIMSPEEKAALRSWEDELAKVEAQKVATLNDIIVGGDDASDVAGSEGTEHLLPADHISMTSQESGVPSDHRRSAEVQDAPTAQTASQKIDNKMDQLSSALEKSLLDEIEQLARQTHTMQNELARARESEYSTDEFSEGMVDPAIDVFRPAGDVHYIQGQEQAGGQIGGRQNEGRESRDSDEYVKITPPTLSGLPSPVPQAKGMTPEEEEQLAKLVGEYDVLDSPELREATLKKPANLQQLGQVPPFGTHQGLGSPGSPLTPKGDQAVVSLFRPVDPSQPPLSPKDQAVSSLFKPVDAYQPPLSPKDKAVASLFQPTHPDQPPLSPKSGDQAVASLFKPVDPSQPPLSPKDQAVASLFQPVEPQSLPHDTRPALPPLTMPSGPLPSPLAVDPRVYPQGYAPESPATQAILADFEQVSPSALATVPHNASDSLDAAVASLQQNAVKREQELMEKRMIPADEQAKLDEVLKDFEMTASRTLSGDRRGQPTTPPHTPEYVDPFGRPFTRGDGTPKEEAMSSSPKSPKVVTFHDNLPTTQEQFPGSPTAEMTFPLAPKESMEQLKKDFPNLPKRASIEIVEPSVAGLPHGVVMPSDLEDSIKALSSIDPNLPPIPESSPSQLSPSWQNGHTSHPSVVPPSSFVDAFAPASLDDYAAGPLGRMQPQGSSEVLSLSLPQRQGMQETPIMSSPSPLPPSLQADVASPSPLLPPLSTFDRPPEGVRPSPPARSPQEMSSDGFFQSSPQMLPAFEGDIGATLTLRRKDERESGVPPDELKNMAEADIFLQDAIDYVAEQKHSPHTPQQLSPPTGFVMEEEMLSSQGESKPHEKKVHVMERIPSSDGTSKMLQTNDVFERIDAPDEHDDVTYAPEIQSVEIPPDQMSETSEFPHDDLPYDLGQSADAMKLERRMRRRMRRALLYAREAEMRAQEQALQETRRSSLQRMAAMAAAPHIVGNTHPRFPSTPSISSAQDGTSSPKVLRKQSSLLSILGVTSTQEMLLKIDSLEALSDAMRKAGLESTNLIFGIDYTASNKYQGEESFGGHSLHTIHPSLKNPYQQVITILGRTLAPFTSTGCIPVFGFGDARTCDWSVFPLKERGDCTSLEEVLKTYNEVTPSVELSGPTNFSPLIYQAIEICQKTREYHILVIIADGQVTNEKATRRAIVQACQYPLSIIVVGVGDGPWEMMRVFDESLPKRPWDNFHFVEFHKVISRTKGLTDADVKVAIQSLLEIPDQYRCVCNLGLLRRQSPINSLTQSHPK